MGLDRSSAPSRGYLRTHDTYRAGAVRPNHINVDPPYAGGGPWAAASSFTAAARACGPHFWAIVHARCSCRKRLYVRGGIWLDGLSLGETPPSGALASGIDLWCDLGALARTHHCRRLQLSRLPAGRSSHDVRSHDCLCADADRSSPSVRQRAAYELLACKHKYSRP